VRITPTCCGELEAEAECDQQRRNGAIDPGRYASFFLAI
jgi:hypothetical protein